MPGVSASGNWMPTSITTISSLYSKNEQLRPISSRPPSGMKRTASELRSTTGLPPRMISGSRFPSAPPWPPWRGTGCPKRVVTVPRISEGWVVGSAGFCAGVGPGLWPGRTDGVAWRGDPRQLGEGLRAGRAEAPAKRAGRWESFPERAAWPPCRLGGVPSELSFRGGNDFLNILFMMFLFFGNER